MGFVRPDSGIRWVGCVLFNGFRNKERELNFRGFRSCVQITLAGLRRCQVFRWFRSLGCGQGAEDGVHKDLREYVFVGRCMAGYPYRLFT